MNIREVIDGDFDDIWPIFHAIINKGDTYAYPQDINKEQAQKLWLKVPLATYVVEKNGVVLGGLAFTPNNESLPLFCWDTLVELPLPFASRHKC